MDILFALLHLAAYFALGIALAVPRSRGPLAVLVAAVGVATLAFAVLGQGQRELEVLRYFPAYEEDGFEIVARAFSVDRTSAPGWQWGAVFAAFALLWAAVLWALRGVAQPRNAFLGPVLLAWSGAAVILLMQKTAAPAAVVQPVGLERALFPACLAAAILLGRLCTRFLHVLLYLCLMIFAARFPVALFSKLASDGHWGTALDVHTITAFVNPLAGLQVEAAPGSPEQQGWLIWSWHLMFVPSMYLMSLGGIAFAVFMFVKHPPPGPRPAAPATD